MKRRTFREMAKTIAVLAGVAALALTGCGSAGGSSSKAASASSGASADASKVKVDYDKQKKLRVAMECSYAPFNWTQDTADVANGAKASQIYGSENYAYGYDVYIAQAIAKYLGWDVEIHQNEWSSLPLGLNSGEYDCIIAGMTKNAEKEKAYTFSSPYYIRDIALVVRKDSDLAKMTTLTEVNNAHPVVMSQIGTSFVKAIDQIPDCKRGTDLTTVGECFMAVQNKAADVFVVDVPTAKAGIVTNPDLTMVQLDASDNIKPPENEVCVAMRKGDSDLAGRIEEALKSLDLDTDKMNSIMDEMITLQPSSN